MDRFDGTEGGDDSPTLIPLHEARRDRQNLPVAFQRRELDQILRLYGRMVAANEWRDYAIDHFSDRAVFSVFRRTSETPLYSITKNPALARKQGEKFDIMTTSFFLNHRSFRSSQSEGLPSWQEKLFVSMARGATNATEFYRLPTNRVLELGQQLTI